MLEHKGDQRAKNEEHQHPDKKDAGRGQLGLRGGSPSAVSSTPGVARAIWHSALANRNAALPQSGARFAAGQWPSRGFGDFCRRAGRLP